MVLHNPKNAKGITYNDFLYLTNEQTSGSHSQNTAILGQVYFKSCFYLV